MDGDVLWQLVVVLDRHERLRVAVDPHVPHLSARRATVRRRGSCREGGGAHACALLTISVMASTMPRPPRRIGTIPIRSASRRPLSTPSEVVTWQSVSGKLAVAS